MRREGGLPPLTQFALLVLEIVTRETDGEGAWRGGGEAGEKVSQVQPMTNRTQDVGGQEVLLGCEDLTTDM